MEKPLHIPESKKFKALRITCYACGELVGDTCKKTGKPIMSCKYGDQHRFKIIAHVPGTRNTRKVKILTTRDYDEAVKQTIDFLDEVKGNKQNDSAIEKTKTIEKVSDEPKPKTLSGEMARYVGYLKGDPEIVPSFMRKPRTKSHIWDVERTFKQFSICLKKSRYDAMSIGVREIDKQHIGKFHDYIFTDLKLSNRSYNKALTIFSSFYKFLNEFENIDIQNPFISVPRKPTHTNVQVITNEEIGRAHV